MNEDDLTNLARSIDQPGGMLERELGGDRHPSRPSGLREAKDPRLDVDALVSIIDGGRSARQEDSRRERLQALRMWREALVRRHEAAERTATADHEPAPQRVEIPSGDPLPQGAGLDDLVPPPSRDALDLRPLERASSHAAIDSFEPDFSHRGFFGRSVARLLAKGVRHLSRFLTTRQAVVNALVVEYAAESADRLNEQQDRINQLKDAVQTLLEGQRLVASRRLQAIQEASDELARQVQELGAGLRESELRSLGHELKLTDIDCDRTWSRVAALDSAADVGRFRRLVEGLGSRLEAQTEQFEALRLRVRAQEDCSAAQSEQLSKQAEGVESIKEVMARADAVDESLAGLEAVSQELLATAESGRVEAESPPSGHLGSALDGLYVNLENEFRGSRELVISRLKSYLPLVRESGAGSSDRPILDIGCGRGEWLELLREANFSARGVEINNVLVSNCRSLGLDVAAGDALDYVHEQPGRRLGMVTAFHVLEHLPFEYVVELLGETLRILEPGGVAVFETPNPENVVVSSTTFHCDPTHRQPLVPQLLVFLMQQQGFTKVRVERQTEGRPDNRLEEIEPSDPLAARLNPVIELLNRHLCAPSDFAVIGYRPH